MNLKENYSKIGSILDSTLSVKDKQEKISELLSDRLLYKIDGEYFGSMFLKLVPFLNSDEINIIFKTIENPDLNLTIDESLKNKVFDLLDDQSDDIYFKLSLMQLESFARFYSEFDIVSIYFKCAFKTLIDEDKNSNIIEKICNLYLISREGIISNTGEMN